MQEMEREGMRASMTEKQQSTGWALEGSSQRAGLDTMGKVHKRETASAEIAGRFSPAPPCLMWSTMLQR